jgi:hypothetical protein
MTASWIEALTAMERRLDAVDAGEPVSSFDPRSPAGPIPPEVLAHAREVLARGQELQERLESEAEEIRAELRRLPRIAANEPGVSRFQLDA